MRPLLLISCVAALTTALALAAMRAPEHAHGGAATPTPPAADTSEIRIRVVHDLDADGAADASEPGLPGYQIFAGCSDALRVLDPTDDDGRTALSVSTFEDRVNECLRLTRNFGWLPTTPLFQEVSGSAGQDVDVVFLLHDLGDTIMELPGEVIVAGLPPADPRFSSAAPPFTGGNEGCIETFAEHAPWSTVATVFVLGDNTRDGCPAPGDRFDVVLEGAVAGTFTFMPGVTAPSELVFVAHGDSMRVSTTLANGARIGDIDCAVVRPFEGFVPPNYVRIFVLSEEVRPGCGAPGRDVRFTADGTPLDPRLPWAAGQYQGELNFTPVSDPLPTPTIAPSPTPTTGIVPPDTGSAGIAAHR